MKRLRFNQIIMIVLIASSIIFFTLQQTLFHDSEESLFLFFQDLIFLPLEILLVTFILDKILEGRQKREKMEHMNMVISAFFSEVGSDVIRLINQNVYEIENFRLLLHMDEYWTEKKFVAVAKNAQSFSFKINTDAQILKNLKSILSDQKFFLLQLFNNPNLLEHDSFTDLIWALYHLLDELENRYDLSDLPESDIDHLSNDVIRAYKCLINEWIYYMKHLKFKYPYLWSLALRTNPFDEKASVTFDS